MNEDKEEYEEDFSSEERKETYEEFCERRAEEQYEAMQIEKHYAQERRS